MRILLTNPHVSVATRQRALQCYVQFFLMNVKEALTITKLILKKMEPIEMWFWRRMLRIHAVRKTKIDVMKEVGQARPLVCRIRSQQVIFISHMRREVLKQLITKKLEGTQAKGRQRDQMIDTLAGWINTEKTASFCNFCNQGSRSLGSMVANAVRQGTCSSSSIGKGRNLNRIQ